MNSILKLLPVLALAACVAKSSSTTPPDSFVAQHGAKAAEPQAAAAPAAGHKAADVHAKSEGGPSALDTLEQLTLGNERFVKGTSSHPHCDAGRRKTLAGGQQPPAIVLSCSDSRVPPELIFDQGLGDLFVVRIAGEVADPAALASIEYAVEHLGSKLVVVLGHEQCGAVKAAISTKPGTSTGSPNIDALVGKIHPHVEKYQGKVEDLNLAVRSQVEGVEGNLMTQSSILKKASDTGHIRIVKGIYKLESGKVDIWY